MHVWTRGGRGDVCLNTLISELKQCDEDKNENCQEDPISVN